MGSCSSCVPWWPQPKQALRSLTSVPANYPASSPPTRTLTSEYSAAPPTSAKRPLATTTPTPWWEEEFNHFRAQTGEVLKLEVFDSDIGFDDNLGTCQRSIQVGVWKDLECYLKRGGTLYYSYTFTP